MEKKQKTKTKNGMVFEIPEAEIYCKKCKTSNFIYNDMKPPYKCDNCGAELKNLCPESLTNTSPDKKRKDNS